MQLWKTLASEMIVDDRWLRLRSDRCKLPNGRVISPYYVLEDYEWVHIVAFSDRGELLTVRQFRYAGKTTLIELPAGICEPGEEPEAAARRELLEETGKVARSWAHLASLWANPARQTNKVHVFLAKDLEDAGRQSLDPSEEIDWEFRPIGEIKHSIRSGEFGQSMHVASFYLGLEMMRAEETEMPKQ